MKLFKCQQCGQVIHFDNTQCLRCGHRLGYLPSAGILVAVDPTDDGWRVAGQNTGISQFCFNAQYDVCNWLVEEGENSQFCLACRHNRVIPDLTIEANLQNWRKVELSKHHLFYSLKRLDLPLATRAEAPETGLAFEFLAEDTPDHHLVVMTGHENGVITLNLAEADDAMREKRRVEMGEPYRTVLGHFRHESGHYFWDRLVSGGDYLPEFRELFGDETYDYDKALKSYYANGPVSQWQENYVSAYASSHPWEDFAETWAHYLHIIDTLEMAGAYGLHIEPALDESLSDHLDSAFDPYRSGTFGQLIDAWLPVTLVLNSLNRCIGQQSFYPFVLTSSVIAKLGFIHALVRARHAAPA